MVPKTNLIYLRIAFLLVLLSGGRLLADDAQSANALLQQGRVDEAHLSLQTLLAAQPGNSYAHQLLCRVYYAQGMADAAIQECELAASQDPSNSGTQMWLGRAYGMKASHANPVVAFGLARKVRYAFERAVQLDPENIQAMSDLGEFYVDAPAIVGGGLDKARALASRMQPRFSSQSHRLLALIASEDKDTATAESEFKKAVLAGRTPAAYIDLGQFYQRQNQPDKALEALKAGIDADRRKDASLVDAASILTAMNQSPQLAEDLLREYLSSSAKSDDAPAFKVRIQLGDLLAHQGDAASAHREYAAAAALASNYAPARKSLQGS
ncbi:MULTISPECIES: lipopolysaccharide assembly protein LapB [Acidobacteriaceae]|uniref:tetratricopeptide repeat protein n=1 Tax=Acidobacteriaceae TaxID=204434 RepID=UPI00131CA7A9|nr:MULTISPECIES: tetratricopeptide repeat protein [Acidobacteriaceae]MDW5266466.1 tetratricopeptide repeat protein [Edaphobacter sp.]